MSGDKRYVYGVIEAEELRLDVDGVEDADSVESIEYKSLAAVVSDVSTLEPEQTDENAQAHDEVLREVMTHGDGRAVVPIRFGMVFESDRAAFDDAIERVEAAHEDVTIQYTGPWAPYNFVDIEIGAEQ